jgi:hypothetical protein
MTLWYSSSSSDVGRLPKWKMAALKPDVKIGLTIERNDLVIRFQWLSQHFATIPDTFITLPTLPDVGWVPEFKMATTLGSWNNFWTVRNGAANPTSTPPYFWSCTTRMWLCRYCPTSAEYRNSNWNLVAISYRSKILPSSSEYLYVTGNWSYIDKQKISDFSCK